MSESDFKAFLSFYISFQEDLARLENMPFLQETVDKTDVQARKLKTRAFDLANKARDVARPIMHWLQGQQVQGMQELDDKHARKLFSSVPEHEYTFTRWRELARHTLSQPEEKVISAKETILSTAIQDLRSLIETNQVYEFKPKGRKKAKIIHAQSDLKHYAYSPDPNLREASYRSLLNAYKNNLGYYFLIFQSQIKDWVHEAEIRGYSSPISMRNTSNDIEDEIVDTLFQVCKQNYTLFQEYFRKKARLMGVTKLRRFDLLAPVNNYKEKPISFTQAEKIVLDNFKGFSENFYLKAKQILDEEHIHSHPHKNKQNGAFCAGITPQITPYILLNYTNKLQDVTVLAHELGHGVHYLYSSKQSILAQHAPIPLAETASTLAESIVFDAIVEKATGVRKTSLLMDKLGDSYSTIIRQIFFAIFEVKAHYMIKRGTTPEELSDMYFETLKDQYGNSVKLDKIFRYEWAYVPHLVRSPFYVYGYAFGELLSMALYSAYKSEGKRFIPRLENILSAGSSQKPSKLLSDNGFNIKSAGFWTQSFQIIENWIREI